ncbi:E3 ubiquitin-protein ligase E3D [Orycteropus afer afer]|uniref:E3 ubiquitin-protein ligase E3D n=1 Tax=Orycteropus afer afer TaxID=1230840 RepID=A0AC54ZD84_ORYAF|nr:E3 ubiquitin-protein ligase E3D [Orycteropus afer afer]
MPTDISITSSSLQMKTPEGCTEIYLPAEVRLVPSSCRGLQYVAGDGLHLRLQTQAELSTKPISLFNQRPRAQEYCIFYCQSCGEVIIRDSVRCLSECHTFDAHPHMPIFQCGLGLVTPKEQSIQAHLGDTVDLAPDHCSKSEYCNKKPKANTKVICKRCKIMLGEIMSSGISNKVCTWVYLKKDWSLFLNTTSQSEELLWLLNSDSLVIGSLENSKSIKKFPLLEDILKEDSSSVWNAIKVLYQPCIKNRNEKLASSWESDISVHSLTLPAATCLELLLILSENNTTLPVSLRCMNSFQLCGIQELVTPVTHFSAFGPEDPAFEHLPVSGLPPSLRYT